MKTKLTNAAIESTASGLGAFVAIELLASGSADANIQLFGMNLNLAQAAGISQAAVQFANELLYKDFLVRYIPESVRPYVDSGEYLGQAVLSGLIPSGLLYLSSGQTMQFADFVKLGLVQYIGGVSASYTAKRLVEPVLDRYI